MIVRVSSLVCSVALAFLGLVVVVHTSFESSLSRKGRYAIKATGVGFTGERTYVRLQVYDYGENPEFLRFRADQAWQPGTELLVPRRSGSTEGAWHSQLYSVDAPPIVNFPKPGSKQHEAELTLIFAGVLRSQDPSAPTAADIDELLVKFSDFGILDVRRSWPIGSDGSVLGQIESSLVERMSLGWAWFFVWVGISATLYFTLRIFLTMKRRQRFRRFFDRSGSGAKPDSENKEGVEERAMELPVPEVWNEEEVSLGIQSLTAKPSMLSIYLDHIRERFIALQDERTAKRRIEFLKLKLEQAKLSKELTSTINDLHLTGLNLEVNRLKLEIERDGLKDKKDKQAELKDLEHERDTLKLRVDIAGSKQAIKELKFASKKLPELSPEQQKAKRKQEITESIAKYEAEKREIKNDNSLSQESKRRRENIIAKKVELLLEDLEQLEMKP